MYAGFIKQLFSQEIHWEEKAPLPKPMRGTAISWRNKIYFIEADKDTSGVYEYDPKLNQWAYKTTMMTQGWNLNLAEVSEIIYAIGGDPFRDRNEAYNPITNKWNSLAPMPTARQHSNCCVFDKKIYVMGGITDWDSPTAKNEMYEPSKDKWQIQKPLPEPTENPIIATIGDKIYALCGRELYCFHPYQNIWEKKKPSPIFISVMFGSAVLDGKLIIPGGQNKENKALSRVYIYDPEINQWSRSTDLPKAIQLGGITTLNGKIYVIGGSNSEFEPYANVYEGTIVK